MAPLLTWHCGAAADVALWRSWLKTHQAALRESSAAMWGAVKRDVRAAALEARLNPKPLTLEAHLAAPSLSSKP